MAAPMLAERLGAGDLGAGDALRRLALRREAGPEAQLLAVAALASRAGDAGEPGARARESLSYVGWRETALPETQRAAVDALAAPRGRARRGGDAGARSARAPRREPAGLARRARPRGAGAGRGGRAERPGRHRALDRSGPQRDPPPASPILATGIDRLVSGLGPDDARFTPLLASVRARVARRENLLEVASGVAVLARFPSSSGRPTATRCSSARSPRMARRTSRRRAPRS